MTATAGPMEDYARMISALVHDLRTPLTSIVGAASSLQSYSDRFDADTRYSLLQGIVDEAAHLDRLLANLSILAKARSGALALDVRPARLSELLNAVLAKARESRETSDIVVSAGAVESTLAIDANLMQSALINLVELASRFAPQPVTIELSATADAGAVRIVVTSPAASNSRARLDSLLTAFSDAHYADRARSSDFILLDAAREVVQSHAGWLSVHAADGADRLDVVVTLPN